MNPLQPLIIREIHEDILAASGAFLLLAAIVILSVFSVLLVSNTELSLLGNAEAVYMMAGIIVALGALIAVIRGSDGFAGERERETLEPLLLSPVSGRQIAFAKLFGILTSWFFLYMLSIPYLWAVGSTGQNLVSALRYLFITGTLMVLIFGSLALTVSSRMKSFRGVLSLGLTTLLLLGSPVVLGASLRQSSVGRILDMVNPLAGALNTLDSVIIDSQGPSFQLIRLSVIMGYTLAAIWCLFIATKWIEP